MMHGQQNVKFVTFNDVSPYTAGDARIIQYDSKTVACYERPKLATRILFNLGLSNIKSVGRDSIVSIGTCYGLDGPGIEPRWRRDGLWDTSFLLYIGYGVSFPGVKRPRCGVDNPPHLALML
jgi:hypothetical protein